MLVQRRGRGCLSRGMTNRFALGAAALVLAGCASEHVISHSAAPVLPYPLTARVEVVDDYHGVKVADPHRWLEDDNSAETKAWVDVQNKLAFAYLAQIPQQA